jgi:hypothetical protein
VKFRDNGTRAPVSGHYRIANLNILNQLYGAICHQDWMACGMAPCGSINKTGLRRLFDPLYNGVVRLLLVRSQIHVVILYDIA